MLQITIKIQNVFKTNIQKKCSKEVSKNHFFDWFWTIIDKKYKTFTEKLSQISFLIQFWYIYSQMKKHLIMFLIVKGDK